MTASPAIPACRQAGAYTAHGLSHRGRYTLLSGLGKKDSISKPCQPAKLISKLLILNIINNYSCFFLYF